MKFQFTTQAYQSEAVASVVQVFAGQANTGLASYRHDRGESRVQDQSTIDFNDAAYRNAELSLNAKQLLENIQAVQSANRIQQSPKLSTELGAVSLDIDMETGTGKTYVYIKTMFELYNTYGWGKYIVVVPSIAIREGVKKSFEITQEHFMEAYGLKARFFVYNSKNLHQLDEYSQHAGISVLIINMQAFNTSLSEEKGSSNKDARIIYSKRDEFGSRRPIDVISANRPIIILDEPQKMGGAATQNALKKNFAPLFSLNYSATHKTQHNLVYVLDALDAYDKKLVKKIEVKGFEIRNLSGTHSYLYLASIEIDRKDPPRAQLELEVKRGTGIKRELRLVRENDNLYNISGELEEYKGFIISQIDPIRAQISFTNGVSLNTGEATGHIHEEDIRRIQIRETIASHFDKEEQLFQQGIKCLSLFFIDEVAKYRQYDEDGNAQLGEYGRMFEEEYQALLAEKLKNCSPAYKTYLETIDSTKTHSGYFSIDKKGRAINSSVKRGSDESDDLSAYDLILSNKERLLSFDEVTRFIFSHSALREGWDNPNIFQICTLKHSENTTAKRQEVGRGLRLCVDQSGQRQDLNVCGEELVHTINLLTVIASESYAQFVSDLQSDIKANLYARPTNASVEYFAGKSVVTDAGQHIITEKEAIAIYNYLVRQGYVDDDGKITDDYRNDAAAGTLKELRPDLQPIADGIHTLVQAIFNPSVLEGMTSNGHGTKVKDNPLNANWKDFQDLWNRINKKYAYTVDFKSTNLIEKAITAINSELRVAKLSYVLMEGQQQGLNFTAERSQTKELTGGQGSRARYDLIGKIAEASTLTRRTVTAILKGIQADKLKLFADNPEEFISNVSGLINNQKAAVVVEHIQYAPSAEPPYTPDIFNMSRASDEYANALQAKKAIQDYVFTDGTATNSVERRFAEDLDIAEEVIVYAKLPRGPKGFSIPTPVGNYSPDWAISFKKDSVKHIFFIAETKGTMDNLQMRRIEEAKITCAKKLFNELSTSEVKYHEVVDYQTLLKVMQTL
jgi:type III restriction enzyme